MATDENVFCCEKVNARSVSSVQFLQPWTDLSFENHTSLRQKARQKLHAIAKIAKDINLGKGYYYYYYYYYFFIKNWLYNSSEKKNQFN